MARPKKGKEKNRPFRVAFHVSEGVRIGLENEAERRGVSMGDIANEALDQYLSRHGNRQGKTASSD